MNTSNSHGISHPSNVPLADGHCEKRDEQSILTEDGVQLHERYRVALDVLRHRKTRSIPSTDCEYDPTQLTPEMALVVDVRYPPPFVLVVPLIMHTGRPFTRGTQTNRVPLGPHALLSLCFPRIRTQ